jgi:TldD protein
MSHPIPPALFAPLKPPPPHDAHDDPLDSARSAILAPAALDEDRVAGVLGEVMGHAVDYADVYFQAVREESWSLEDGIVKDGAHSIDRGVGVRALAGERTGFAYSD